MHLRVFENKHYFVSPIISCQKFINPIQVGGPELMIQGGGKNACATYFGHISSMEAWIFMKFEIYVHKIVFDHQPNFQKDLCKDARAQGENARTCDV